MSMDKGQDKDSSRLQITAEHPLATKIVGDPAVQAPLTVTATGYVGRSAKEGLLRIYTSQDFDSYIEIQPEALVHREDMRSDLASAPSLLWIRWDAQVTLGSRSADAAARGTAFLAGDIAAHNLGMTSPADMSARAARVAGGAWSSPPHLCPSIRPCPITTFKPCTSEKQCTWDHCPPSTGPLVCPPPGYSRGC